MSEAIPRILILTSSTGGGHDSRSYSLEGWLKAESDQPCEVRVVHILEASSWLPRFGVWVYNTIQKHAPWLHNVYWWIAEGFAWTQGQKLSFGREYYLDLLKAFRPHLIVSMHDCTNRGYFQEAKALLGEKTRCVTYCGEWSGGFGFSRNWLEPTADLYISRTNAAQDYAIKKGMPEDRCRVFRNLLSPRAFEPLMTKAERVRYRREELGLSPDRFTVLLATGQVGANNHRRLLDMLRKRFPQTQAIVVCGRNRRAFDALQLWQERHPDYPLILEGYSKRMNSLLQVADCIVTRGGSNSTAEAHFYGCPIIFNTMGGVMPQERLTLNYFLNKGAAGVMDTADDLASILDLWTGKPSAYRAVKANMKALKQDDHPASLVPALMELACQAAGLPCPAEKEPHTTGA